MNKTKRLEALKQKMAQDETLPLKDTATNLVFGEGSVDPKIYFLGEAPGRFEDLSGRPFVGAAGKMLTKLLEGIGIDRSEVYITSVLRYRPPGNRDPKPEEIEAFRPYVDEEIETLEPAIIATLGRFSLNKFLPDVKISQVHGQPHRIDWHGQRIIIMPLYHPAAALRARKLKEALEQDFLKLRNLLD